MAAHGTEASLLERFERAVRQPPLMMLYPPVSTGAPYSGAPGAGALWERSAAAGTLYVHFPFCRLRCSFCPFYAVAGRHEEHADYVEAVLAEAALYAASVAHVRFSSVYLGGGTPSLLPAALIGRLLRGLAERLRVDGADVTLEAHPSTVTRAGLRELCAAGVTRLSLGVQAFDARVLEACGRGETAVEVLPAVEAALAAPLRDLNVDLMYGLPEQTAERWAADLRTAVALGVPGLTLYATVYLPEFRSRCEARRFTVPSAEDRQAMYELAYEYLQGAGYPQPHYGAGAFLRGALNPHRRNVARGLPTLGLGAWAYSSSGAFAYHNRFPADEWAGDVRCGRLPIRHIVAVPEAERARKHVIEALLLAHVSLERFREAAGTELAQAFPEELAVLERLGLATIGAGELRLTRRGGRHLREIRYLFASDAVVDAMEGSAAPGL